ncbi:phage holin family protein [Carnobacterium jeotgali]|uniref:phage holin family protein n=1 Tax=Carnobacterium jeotgali TaxID=545534 RepID=UPI000691BF78|nr:phage holin family protein [Carnobacterium jeotgali]
MLYLKLGTHAGTLDKIALTLGLLAGFLFGGWHELLTALLILQGLDIFTGLLVGGKDKNISSSVMNAGIKKKIGTWIAIILAHVIDIVLFDKQPVAQMGIIFVLLGNEGLSLVENLGKLGVPIPEMITKYLIQIRSHGDKQEVKAGDLPASGIEQVVVVPEEGKPQILTKDE